MKNKQFNESEKIEDILLKQCTDRRLLSNVPDVTKQRTNKDRRNSGSSQKKRKKHVINTTLAEHEGIRYEMECEVSVICYLKGKKKKFTANSKNISTSGILLNVDEESKGFMEKAKKIKLKFKIQPGTMPEGYEMKVVTYAFLKRTIADEDSGSYLIGLSFKKPLPEYAYKRVGRSLRRIAIVSLIVLTVAVVLLRVGSVIYFRFNTFIYIYSIITATYLLSRYFFAAFYKPVPVNEEYTPGVSIIIPCFNEEEWIHRTILGCINQDYPPEKLEVIVVDDCSNDNSYEKAKSFIEELYKDNGRYDVKNRLTLIKQPENKGKREALAVGAKLAKHELIVFVDSDSFLDPNAIMNVVQPFQDPKMGGVTGRTDVANTYTNALTKMQSVRYYIAFRILKAAEAYFDAVTCLSGPISCYRKDLVLENLDRWLNQGFLGRSATFGDDRAMTNFILRNHRTFYQDTAICYTIVPNDHKTFLKQQMRWKRSWLRESFIAGSFMWRKEPLMALSFYMGFVIPLAAPVIVIHNLVYVPIVYRTFPLTFLLGLFIMAMLMSVTQMLLRRSRTWIYGVWFCLYYVLILMWQMPIAWFTFGKTTWGTRMTQADIEASRSILWAGVSE